MITKFESSIPKFQGLELKGLKFRGLGLGGLDLIGLKFESMVSDPFVLDPRPGLKSSGLEMFLGFDLG